MKIKNIHLFRFSIPFQRPINAGGRQMTQRKGLILGLEDNQGCMGWGEAAPLAGVDRVHPDQCLKEMHTLQDVLLGQSLCWQNFDPCRPAMGLVDRNTASQLKGLSPVTAFGLEAALIWLGLGTGKWAWPAGQNLEVAVNGLFVPSNDPKDVDGKAEALKAAGISTVKVKIGRLNPAEEIRQILALDNFFEGECLFRIDANRTLDPERYQMYYQSLKHIPVEYAEEPLMPEFPFFDAARVPWPLAMDESLDNFPDLLTGQGASSDRPLNAVILKPGAVSGVSGMVQAINRLRQQGVKTVMSSAYNTGIGIAALAGVAGFCAKPCAHGLDTLKYFHHDLFSPGLSIAEGCLRLSGPFFQQPLHFHTECMETIF